jgi:hypothetical protein
LLISKQGLGPSEAFPSHLGSQRQNFQLSEKLSGAAGSGDPSISNPGRIMLANRKKVSNVTFNKDSSPSSGQQRQSNGSGGG